MGAPSASTKQVRLSLQRREKNKSKGLSGRGVDRRRARGAPTGGLKTARGRGMAGSPWASRGGRPRRIQAGRVHNGALRCGAGSPGSRGKPWLSYGHQAWGRGFLWGPLLLLRERLPLWGHPLPVACPPGTLPSPCRTRSRARCNCKARRCPDRGRWCCACSQRRSPATEGGMGQLNSSRGAGVSRPLGCPTSWVLSPHSPDSPLPGSGIHARPPLAAHLAGWPSVPGRAGAVLHLWGWV